MHKKLSICGRECGRRHANGRGLHSGLSRAGGLLRFWIQHLQPYYNTPGQYGEAIWTQETLNAAYSIFAEDSIGSLEVGKLADLIVIDRDLFAIDPMQISDTQVLRTYFSGRLVYSR